MATRLTIETIVRDADDATGADIRQWSMCKEGDNIVVKQRTDDGFFIFLAAGDVDQFVADLLKIRDVK